MMSNMIAATALLASAPFANAVGRAIVKNACNYEVKMCSVPASGGGYDEIDQWLQPNETYSQEWTELSNGNGWALKLSDTDSLEHILQYEYTYLNDGTIWYDLSQVNGNPWYGNWQITAEGSNCDPKQQAYRYANDDAYGMQSCTDDAEITVTLCSGEGYNDDMAAEASASVKAASMANTVSWAPLGRQVTSAPASTTSAPVEQATTLVTKASAAPDNGAVTKTVYQTIYVRETAPAQRAHRRHGHDQH